MGVVCAGLYWAWQAIVKRNGNQIEKLIEMPRNGGNNNGQVMRLSTAHTQQQEEGERNPKGNPEEGNPEKRREREKSKLATSSRIYLLD